MSYDINQILSSPKFDLHQIFIKLVGKGGPYDGQQKKLGKLLGIDGSQVSRLKGGGVPEVKEHWFFSIKLLMLCMDHKVITEHDLLGLQGHGHSQNPGSPKAGKAEISSHK